MARARALTGAELFAIEIETLWERDARGRLVNDREEGGRRAPHIVIGSLSGGYMLAVGSEVPEAVATELQGAIEDMPPRDDPAAPPAALDRCARILRGAVGDIEVTSGPSYVIPAGTSFESVASVRTSGEPGEWRREAPEGSGWRVDEWDALLDGKLGPWAMASVDDRVVSICHSARLADRGAEAGTWTDPAFRGRGYAAATTAAWASLFSPGGRVLFYGTSAENVSSQRVAERLGLPLIGWLWKLGESREG